MRLALGFGSLVGLMLLTLSLVSWQLHHITDLTERFATQDMQRLLRVQVLALTTEGAGTALLRLMNAPRADRVPVYADVDERNRRIDGIVTSLQGLLGDAQQEQTLVQLEQARAVYHQAFLATVDQIEADDASAAMQAYTNQVQPALAHLLQLSNQLVNRERERMENQVASSHQRLLQITLWLALLSLLAVIMAAALAWRTTQSVVSPMRQLETTARRIAAGDYAAPLVTASIEEVDRVSQAMSSMTQAIAQREQEIERLAFRDPLTDLPNRTYLLKHCAQCQSTQAGNTLMLLDLARLKTVNETLGFAIGDSLIKTLAEQAAQVVKTAAPAASTLLAHLSGGLFAVVLRAETRDTVQALHQQLLHATAQPLPYQGHSVDLSLAFGVADSPLNAPLDVITLLRNAEVALNAAKQAAQTLVWYNPAQEAARLSHLGLLSDLRVAVTESQLQMWLQPKFSLHTGQAVGAEALVRWQHPTRGFVSPAEFVPFAEQTGAITQVTDWMLSQAVHTLAAWQHHHPELSLSVNVSTRDLQDPTFCQRVLHLLQQHGIAAQHLRLEIVESGLMQDTHTSIALLHSLRSLGVQLSIDDFGTGYSSLAYLQQLPVTELKIDRSFVTHIEDLPGTQRLVKTMIEMGHGMDLLVTAEGIETEAERAVLQRLGCDVMQGYLGSRPLHGVALQAWLDGLSTSAPDGPGAHAPQPT